MNADSSCHAFSSETYNIKRLVLTSMAI